MSQIVVPDNEFERLKRLEYYAILDSEKEAIFDEIVEMASDMLHVPIALVSLLDDKRQWFKARVGLAAAETARDISFCQFAILQDDVFVVENALEDRRFFQNPLVIGEPNIRFYAGQSLKDPDGYNLGTLCVIDSSPRHFSDKEKKILKTLANTVMRLIELRKEKMRAELLLKQKEEFISNISHDIRTPINAVMGFAELLEKTPLNDTQKRYLHFASAAASTMVNMVDNILEASKLENAETLLAPAKLELVPFLVKMAEMNKLRAEQKGVALRLHCDGNLPPLIMADELKLSRILVNLLSNAIKFTSQGEVSLTVSLCENWGSSASLLFAIEDSGMGIEPEKIPLLFKRFTQAHVGIEKQFGGSGLGLNIVQRLVELHNGSIEIQSELGKGTKALVRLLFALPQEKQREMNLSVGEFSSTLKDKTILIVSPNQELCLSSKKLVSFAKGDCLIAPKGADAIKLLQHQHVDLLVIDFSLPSMDGLRLAQVVRNVLKRELPICLLVNDSFNPSKEELSKERINARLIKPVQALQLVRQVAQLLAS